MRTQLPIVCSPEVRAAVEDGRPVVALESTIIAHGMPYPQNVETARRVENIVRAGGAIPATCAIIEGRLKAGLSAAEIEHLGEHGHQIPKASRRDLAYLISQRQHGATTVASTMIIAHLAGIRIFATGGIGGVHRGAPQTFDISADLQELGHTPIAVVSAGAKSILDLGLTLEYLETLGVPVIGYKTTDFPAFYAKSSGFNVDFRLDAPSDVAQLLRTHWQLPHAGGVLIANPAPEAWQMDATAIQHTIEQAIILADRQGIKGKALTPFLLSKIEQLTGGKSLETNIELVCHNAQLGAAIAVALAAD